MSGGSSGRLEAIAAMVPPCGVFYDIGTDHGKLPAFLLREGRCREAAPCDISPDSLAKAERLFAKLGLTGRFHLGDGLEGLRPGAEDCVAICGVGARTMLRILPEGLPCPVVLSTHVDVEELRRGLFAKGYGIEKGRLVLEDRRFYLVLRVHYGLKNGAYSEAELFVGRELRGDPLLGAYLAWKEKVARKAGLGAWLRWIEEARRGLLDPGGFPSENFE